MSRFTGPLLVQLNKQQTITLIEELVWEIDELGSNRFVTIPAGTESDGITVPRFLWWLIPPVNHPAVRAAVLHDWLLRTRQEGQSKLPIHKQFYLALLACQVPRFLAMVMYGAVCIFNR